MPLISDHVDAEVDFYPHDRDFATASLAPWTHPHHVEPVKCPLTTIDELARDWQRLDLVKIDAEGAELAVWHRRYFEAKYFDFNSWSRKM